MREFKKILLLLIVITALVPVKLFGQKKNKKQGTVYKLNNKVEVPVTLGLLGLSVWGYGYVADKDGLSYEKAISLKPEDVWKFDRGATRQDPDNRDHAQKVSDVLLNTTVILPAALFFDKNIRKDLWDVLVLYGESHAINSSLYILNTSLISRPRPYNYHADVSLEEKMAKESRNSFFSGHVSSTASASFFMAKVYSDYHPEIGNKKYWLFAAAAIPPALVGLYRYKAMKHFPTDVLVGMGVGAACGILIPHFHKIKEKETAWSFVPFAGKINGLHVSYTFR